MYAFFTLELSIGMIPFNQKGNTFDAGFVPFQIIQNLHTVPRRFRPTGIHPQEHFHPILGLGSTCASMEGDNCIFAVVFTGKQDKHFKILKIPD
jgi:hypothetical protein